MDTKAQTSLDTVAGVVPEYVNHDPLLTDPDICEKILGGVNLTTLWRQRKLGKFPEPIKIGKLNRTRWSVIRKWLEAQEREAAARQAGHTSAA